MTWPYYQRINTICEMCEVKPASEVHHKYSQSKYAKETYKKLIHHPLNTMNICYDCHHQKPLIKYTEAEFRAVMTNAGIVLPDLLKPTGACRRIA